MTKRAFGELELAVLNILKSGKRMTVKDVHSQVGKKDKYTTIMTVMVRLTEKNVLARERVGTHYEYWLPTFKGHVASFIQQIKKKLFGLNTTEMVSYLIESAEEISDEEFEAMEKMLQEAKKNKKMKKKVG